MSYTAAGSVGIVFLFVYFRFMSNRCSAPVTLFDTIVGVALGSVLGAIVTGKFSPRGRFFVSEEADDWGR